MLISEKVIVRSHPQILVRAAGMVGFTVLLCFAAFVRIPLPFTPVPVTLQNMVALLAGGVLGSVWGAGSVALYALLGIVGVPLFANSGAGLSYLAGPTGGYLIGFAVASWLVGYGMKKVPAQRSAAIFGLMLLGMTVVYFFGGFWLYLVFRWSAPKIFVLGIAPFVGADLVKALLAAAVCRRLVKAEEP